jgi:ParB family transcriptional regulator, chromosome partitioning protein
VTETTTTMSIQDINVPGWCLRNVGDIAGLADSIRRVGLVHPVVVTQNGVLIDGFRRLLALHLLERSEAPVTVFEVESVEQAVRMRIDANTWLPYSEEDQAAFEHRKKLVQRRLARNSKKQMEAQP